MRTWTKSACVVLAWSILPIILMVGAKGSTHLTQANTRTMSSTNTRVTSSNEVLFTSTLSVAAAPVTTTNHATRYVVRDGDTLYGIAIRFAVRGGWPALYAANRQVIGPDPNVIHAGTVLVVPGRMAPIRYAVAAGDTLSGIATGFAVRGGWPALYTANRGVIGPNPNVIHAGTVLTVPGPAALPPRTPAPSPLAPGRVHRRQPPTPQPSPRASARTHPRPGARRAPTATGMQQWLKIVLLAVGLLILAAFLVEPVLAVRRRRRRAPVQTPRRSQAGVGRRRDRGRSSRSVAAAARVHPMGLAVPSAALAAGIVLFTFVKAATVRVTPPPAGSEPGSVCAARTGQLHYGLQPGQPGPAGQPRLPFSPGQNTRCLTGGLEHIASPLPVPTTVPSAGPGRAPRASRIPSSPLPASGPVGDARQGPRLRLRPRPEAGG